MSGLSNELTLGYSPKAVLPVLGITAVGGALMAVGSLLDSRMLRASGLGALCSSVVAGTLGYMAPPGAVVPPDFDVVDAHEHEHVNGRFVPGDEHAGAGAPTILASAGGDA